MQKCLPLRYAVVKLTWRVHWATPCMAATFSNLMSPYLWPPITARSDSDPMLEQARLGLLMHVAQTGLAIISCLTENGYFSSCARGSGIDQECLISQLGQNRNVERDIDAFCSIIAVVAARHLWTSPRCGCAADGVEGETSTGSKVRCSKINCIAGH